MNYKNYSPKYVVKLAQKMRSDMTNSEKLFWTKLSLRKFEGLRFRRQNPIGRYIADFYCHELKLIIEIDGEIHSKQRQYDKNRDAYLAACGYITMRFTDREIIENVDGVLNRIRSAIKSK